VNDFYMCINSE